MNQFTRCIAVLALVGGAVLQSAGSNPADVSPRIAEYLASDADGTVRAWVYLRAREGGGPGVSLAPRSVDRRVRRSRGLVTDRHDRPVSRESIAAIAATGATVRHASRYLNAVSVVATRRQLDEIRGISAVGRITRVASWRRSSLLHDHTRVPEAAPRASTATDDYGPSRRQVEQIGVIPLHDEGHHGEGVLIAVFDTGFNRGHDALDHLDVVAEWDFIFGDSVTQNDASDVISSQHSHGTNVLSTVAGYAPGNLIGPAWAASVVLAKTERQFEEVQGEEDDFVRALEWADSIGVDIVTASLGYYDWYDYSDLDGNTAVTTVACDIAASKGITVVTSIGNQGSGGLGWPGVLAPADGDSVIAVGAVDSFGVVVGFSSRGPTYDGRIKPDLMAMGQSVLVASAYDSLTYFRSQGTSFSAPLLAGACALLLQVHPEWGPAEVLSALRSEASNAASPDNNYGWGVIDAYQSAVTGATGVLSGVTLAVGRVAGGIDVSLTHAAAGAVSVDLVRRRRATAFDWDVPETLATGVSLDSGTVWRYLDADVPAGVYEYRVRLTGDPSQVSSWRSVTVPFAFVLRQSAPNPFNPASGPATIRFSLSGAPAESPSTSGGSERVELSVYNVRGALVNRLFSQPLGPGDYEVSWTGQSQAGDVVASGVYFYKLSVGSRALTRKMVVVRP